MGVPEQVVPALIAAVALLPAAAGLALCLIKPRHDSRSRVAVLLVPPLSLVAAAVLMWHAEPAGNVTLIFGRWLEVTPDFAFTFSLRWDVFSRAWWLTALFAGCSACLTAWMARRATQPERHGALVLVMLSIVSLIVLAGDFLQLFAAWVWLLAATAWGIGVDETQDSAPAARRLLVSGLFADVLLFAGLVGVWLAHGSLTFTDVLAPISDPAMATSHTLLSLTMLPSVLVRCGAFPFCTWLLDSGAGRRSEPSLLVAALNLAALSLLWRCAPLLAEEPAAQTLLAGIGTLAALAWGGLAVVQTDLSRAAACFTGGTLAFLLAAMGVGVAAGPLPLLPVASVVPGLWMLLILSSLTGGDGPSSSATANVRRSSLSVCLMLITAALGSGLLGQEYLWNQIWSAAHVAPADPVTSSDEDGPIPDEDQQPAASHPSPALPIVLLGAHFLLTCGLLRTLLAQSKAAAAGEARASATAGLYALSIASVAFGPVMSRLLPRTFAAAGRTGQVATLGELLMPGLMLISFLLALLACWGLLRKRLDIDRQNLGGSPLMRVLRRRFYIDEIAWITCGLPLRLTGYMLGRAERLLEEGERDLSAAPPSGSAAADEPVRSLIPLIGLFLIAALVSLLLWNM